MLRWLLRALALSHSEQQQLLPPSSEHSNTRQSQSQSQSQSPCETHALFVRVLLQEYFKCPYEEKCRMDPANRRFCKRCRLKRCFEIGMRKEYILSDDEKLQKRIKIENNRCASCVPFFSFSFTSFRFLRFGFPLLLVLRSALRSAVRSAVRTHFLLFVLF